MTHIPFKHYYAKSGAACYIADQSAEQGESAHVSVELPTATSTAPPAGSSTLSYSDASSAGSTESFPSSCSDHSSEMGNFISDSRSPSDSSSKFDELMPHTGKKTVLVTGGAGFIGSWVADTLLARGDDVVIVDEVNDYYDVRTKRSNIAMLFDKYGANRVRFFEGDLCDAPFISRIFENEGIQWVVHLAARAGVRPSIEDPFVYVHSNVEATTRLLELARLHAVKSFVFASSSSVYGGNRNEVFSETDVVDFPVSPYAATKKSCELMAHTYSHLYGLNVAGLRFFTVYGPRGRPDMAPYKFIDLVCRGQEIMQFGDGSTSRDYTYISDIVDGVIRSLDRPAGYQIYNLGNGSPVSLSSFIQLVEESVGTPAKIRICPEQPGDVPRTCANITKAREMLGYDPSVSFADGICKTVAWYRDRASSNSAAAAATAVATLPNADNARSRSFAAEVDGANDEPFSVVITHDTRTDRGRSLSCTTASALGMEVCSVGVRGSRPRSLSKPGPDALMRATRALSFVSDGSCVSNSGKLSTQSSDNTSSRVTEAQTAVERRAYRVGGGVGDVIINAFQARQQEGMGGRGVRSVRG